MTLNPLDLLDRLAGDGKSPNVYVVISTGVGVIAAFRLKDDAVAYAETMPSQPLAVWDRNPDPQPVWTNREWHDEQRRGYEEDD